MRKQEERLQRREEENRKKELEKEKQTKVLNTWLDFVKGSVIRQDSFGRIWANDRKRGCYKDYSCREEECSNSIQEYKTLLSDIENKKLDYPSFHQIERCYPHGRDKGDYCGPKYREIQPQFNLTIRMIKNGIEKAEERIDKYCN